MAAFINNFNECGIEKLLKDLSTFCESNPENCTTDGIIKNAQVNVFVVIGKFNEIA